MSKLTDQLRPLFYVNIFFGLPPHYRKNNLFICLYSLFLSFAIPSYIFYTLVQRAKPNKSSKKMRLSVSSLMNYIQVQLVIAAVTFIYMRNYFRRFIFQYVILHVEQVDEKLQTVFKFENRGLKIATMAQFPVIIIYGSTQSINFGFKIITLKRSLLQAVTTTFVNTLLFLLMFQMVIYSKILKNRFNKLNTFLVKLITSRVYCDSTLPKDHPSHLTHFSTQQRRFHMLDVTSIHQINSQLQQLVVVHYELNKVCDALNDSYNVQITIVIAVTVLGVASMLQTTTTNLMNYFYKQARNMGFILYVCFWISLGMLCLFWLISNISNMQSEGNLTPLLANKLMMERREFREQVQLFTKVIHVKRVEFSACRLFPINHSLVFAILGAITTYWAILIQFQLQLSNS